MTAVTVFSVGATVVHVMDIMETGNLAPGNTLQNVLNLLKPALLIWALTTARRLESAPNSESHSPAFDRWRGPVAQAAGIATACVATAFGVGYAINRPILATLAGSLISCLVVYFIVIRSPGDGR